MLHVVYVLSAGHGNYNCDLDDDVRGISRERREEKVVQLRM